MHTWGSYRGSAKLIATCHTHFTMAINIGEKLFLYRADIGDPTRFIAYRVALSSSLFNNDATAGVYWLQVGQRG